MVVSNRNLLLQGFIFRCYVSFREGSLSKEKWSIEKMKYHEKPHAERSYTACYHGADSDAMAIYHYANATVSLERLES